MKKTMEQTLGTETASNSRFSQIISAALLGVTIFLLVGFLPVSAVHNAAHDVRHAAAFPCH